MKKREIAKVRTKLNDILEHKNAKLISFHYYDKIFGNFVIRVKLNNKLHVFTTDKGEIYHNQNMVCDNSYHRAGRSDTCIKLLRIIESELDKEFKCQEANFNATSN